ncbi:MAG: ATPase [Gammaproteobacteria bacterium]|nr:ATPase [Gammaproteobacteria bacterium]
MYWLVGVITLSLLGIMALGVYLELYPVPTGRATPRWWKGTVGMNLLTFVGGSLGLLLLGVHDVLAEEAGAAGPLNVSVGLGLALIGIGIPTALATVGAGLAVGPVGAAALAVISEKPEMFGRTLIYLGLAEGIAIYGLVVTILLLGKIG